MIKLQIFIIGEEERFKFLLPQYCKGQNGALILFDITNRHTLDHVSDWIQILREHAGDILIMLIGNKLELAPNRVITREEGISIAKNYNLSAYAEISAKTGQYVEKVFEMMTELLLESINM